MLASLNYRIAETQECRRHVLRRRSEDELLLLDAPASRHTYLYDASAQEQGEGDIARLPPNCVHHSDEAMQTSRHRQKQTSLKLLVSYFFIRPQTRGRRTLAVREEDCTQFAREAVYRPKGERGKDCIHGPQHSCGNPTTNLRGNRQGRSSRFVHALSSPRRVECRRLVPDGSRGPDEEEASPSSDRQGRC